MPRHNSVVLISVLVHVGVLAAIVLLSILAADVLPMPRTLLAWNEPRLVQMDIAIPPKPPKAKPLPATAQPVSPDAAPLLPPDGVRQETGYERINTQTLEAGIVDGGTAITNLETAEAPALPPPPSVAPRRLHSGMTAPRKTADALPVYPPLAQATHVSGVVIIEVVISESGEVTSAKVLRSIPLLDRAALDAVQRWHFEPARLNGEAIPVVMTVTVNFQLNQ